MTQPGDDNGEAPIVLRPPAPAPARISRKAVIAGAAVIGGLLFVAIIYGLQRPGPASPVDADSKDIPFQRPPDALAGIPKDYSQIPPPPLPPAPPAVTTDQPAPGGPTSLAPAAPASAAPPPRNPQVDAEKKRMEEEINAARRSGLFVVNNTQRNERQTGTPSGGAETASSGNPSRSLMPASTDAPEDSVARQNMQDRKNQFLRAPDDFDVYVRKPYVDPLSPYEVKAGTIIPAALVTGLNSDLPGDVIAKVTENVYDSVSGRYLLIPQGATLMGIYDSFVAFGQERALVAWQRIIMPNGKSIQIPRMPATDQAGAAGLEDGVDYHLSRVAVGLGISTVISFLGNLSRDRGDGERTIITDVGDTVTQESARVGSRVADRFLNIQPTITIRQGWPVRVLINRDLVLSPYDPRLLPAGGAP